MNFISILSSRLQKFIHSDHGALLLLWITVTAFNFTKPMHMDDPVYIYCARAIVQSFFHPYAGTVLWGTADFVPLSSIAQPAFTFYILAAVLHLFGESEFPLHLLQSLYSLLAIVCFYRAATLIKAHRPIFLTALFSVSPAFIPSQNLMTDIPLIAGCLLFFCFVVTGLLNLHSLRSFGWAGFTAGITCLIKYTGLILLPIYLLSLILRRTLKVAPLIVLPLLVLGGWCLANYIELGEAHLLVRPQVREAGVRFSENALEWIVCLGSVAPFSFLFLRAFSGWWGKLCLGILACLIVFWFPAALQDDAQVAPLSLLTRIFWANGTLVLFGVCIEFIRTCAARSSPILERRCYFLFGVWILGGFLFIAFFSRFIAVRHLLVVLPPIILTLSARILSRTTGVERGAALAFTIILGAALGISDWKYAALYPKVAQHLSAKYRDQGQLWQVGLWGWQWYAQKEGMSIYSVSAPLKNRDIVIVPEVACPSRIALEHQHHLFKLEDLEIASTLSTYLRTMATNPWGGYYSAGGSVPPWRFTESPLETFHVFQYLPNPSERIELPLSLDLSQDQSARVNLTGFHAPENWGRWVGASHADIHFNRVFPSSFRVTFIANGYGNNREAPLLVRVGAEDKTIRLQASPTAYSIDFHSVAPDTHSIQFQLTKPLSTPSEIQGGGDIRPLGMALASLRLDLLP